MKTIPRLIILAFLTVFCQEINAQSLSKKVQKSVVEIGETFTHNRKERLFVLDQVAFKLFKKHNEAQPVDVYFVDETTHEKSQLAMIWLRTGLMYYNRTSVLNIHATGVNSSPNDPDLNMLQQYGFKVKNKKGKYVKFGSGSWEISSNTIEALNLDEEDEKIYLTSGVLSSKNKNSIELPFSTTDDIAREMLYIATRLNNLFQNKQ